MLTVQGNDIRIGTQLAEADGFLFEVIAIVRETPQYKVVKLASDFSSFKSHWRINGGKERRFKKSCRYYGFQPGHTPGN